ETTLGSYVTDLPINTDYVVKLQVVGSDLEVFVDGVSRITATDSAISAAGFVGVMCATNGRVDDLATDIGGGGGTTVSVTRHDVPVVIGSPSSDTTVTCGVTGLAVPVAMGAPTASTAVTVPVTGLEVPVAFGTPSVVQDNVPQTVTVDGLEIPVVFGDGTVAN